METIIRKATEKDLEAILEIYNHSIIHTTSIYSYTPHTIEMIKKWFDEKLENNCPVFVAEIDNKVAGFAAYGSFRTWPAYKYSVEHSVHVQEAKFSITFTVFRNIAPVAQFAVKKIGVSSPYEYEVDASASYDKDARFSGKIAEYEYTLANYIFSSPLNKIRYVFGSAGQKQIRVRVKDNSGDWSNQVSEYVVLN